MSMNTKRNGKPLASNHVESVMEENVQAIKDWECEARHRRSKAEQLSDWITSAAASGPVLLLHVIWFAAWIAMNVGAVPGVTPFDPFPFPFLTMAVSLEAIFLALFVLASQNRLSRQTDKREHLDLQIDLLAEREMTAVLHLLRDIAAHLQVPTTVTADQIRDLIKKTNLRQLTSKVEELSEDDTHSETKSGKPPKLAKLMGPPGRRAWRRTHCTN
jgi:uncharacterized membrane protein